MNLDGVYFCLPAIGTRREDLRHDFHVQTFAQGFKRRPPRIGLVGASGRDLRGPRYCIELKRDYACVTHAIRTPGTCIPPPASSAQDSNILWSSVKSKVGVTRISKFMDS